MIIKIYFLFKLIMDKNYIINIKSDKNIFNSKSALSKFKNIIKNNWNNKNNVINNIFYDYVNPTYTYNINIINENEIDINFELKCNQEINTSKKTLNLTGIFYSTISFKLKH